MRSNKRIFSMLCAFAATCGTALGLAFTWTGGDGDWDDENNWTPTTSCSYLECYPQSTSDDATVSGDVTVTLVEVEIDDLTISNSGQSDGGPTFDGGEDLVCDTITIVGGANADTVATVTGTGSGTSISTN
jgi:hypothetical protein